MDEDDNGKLQRVNNQNDYSRAMLLMGNFSDYKNILFILRKINVLDVLDSVFEITAAIPIPWLIEKIDI